ncbi:MAG: iron-containing alcohol dehydrogenase, partial [Elusimicrobia bacterium]|nr:iron-containing alcohol dehydrogenase [Elusimicrobiota bacterium]
IIIPGYLKFNLQKGKFKRISRFGKNVLKIGSNDDKTIAKETIETLKNWFSDIGAPITLKEANIPETDIPFIVENAMGTIKLWGMSYAKKSVEEILRNAA